MPFPLLNNIPPLSAILRQDLLPVKTTTCLQWHYFSFSSKADKNTKNFIGYNNGNLIGNSSQGMFSSMLNNWSCEFYSIINGKIKEKNTPFFKEANNVIQFLIK